MLATAVRWSLRHARLLTMACLGLAIVGVDYASGAKLDIFPPIAPAETAVQTEAPGLVAEQVERLVTRPVENVLLGAAGVARVRSESVQGLSVISIDFAPGADPRQVQQALSARVAEAAHELPPGVAAPRIRPLASATGEILEFGLVSGRLDPMQLRSLAQWTVRPRLLSAPGVALVSVYGGQTRRIEVRARPGDLSDSDLGLLDVVRAVQRSTSVAGAGFIDTPTQRVLIEPRGQALSIEDVKAGQIQSPGNAPVRIGDVSDVMDAAAPALGDALVDGRPGVVIGIEAQYGANTVEATRAVDRALAELEPALSAQGVTVVQGAGRPAGVITAAVKDVLDDLLIGAGLALILLIVALRDWRAALISFAAIPLSLLAAVVALRALGLSLNTMTLGGLVLGLGVVIDDALIDVENIMTRLREAERRHSSHAEAVLRAALEVRAPVVYGTLAIALALVPILGLPGEMGALLRPLALAAILGVLASLLVAVLVTPALALLFLPHVGPSAHPRVVQRLKHANRRWLERRCAAPAPVLWPVLAAVAAAAVALVLMRTGGPPQLHGGRVTAEVAAPGATSLDAMRDYGRRISLDLKAIPGVETVSEQIGRDPTDAGAAGIEHSRFDVGLAPSAGVAAQEKIADRIRGVLGAYPGLAASVSAAMVPRTADPAALARFSVAVSGDSLDAVDVAARRIERVLRAMPGAGEVSGARRPAAPAVRIDLNFKSLAIYGLSAADVMETLQTAFEGQTAARVYDQGQTVDIAVTAQSDLRSDPEAVGDLLLRSTSGVSVPLKKVAKVYLADARTSIDHEGGVPREVVIAEPKPRDAARFARAAEAQIAARVGLPAGIYLQYPDLRAAGGGSALLLDIALATAAVLALLVIAFRNGRSALLILSAAPPALAGGVLAAALFGGALTVGALVGFIALIGLSIRNAILLISRIEELVVRRGAERSLHTVIIAAQDRLIPILLAALAIALGLAPLVLRGGQPGSEILRPMAAVVLGGLVSGSAFSVLVLPILAHLFWRPRRHEI